MLGASVQLAKLPKTQQISNKATQEASSPFCLCLSHVQATGEAFPQTLDKVVASRVDLRAS